MKRTLLRALVGIGLCLSSSAWAATYTFTGATDYRWSDPTNWSPVGTPGSNDTVVIPSNVYQSNDIAGLTLARIEMGNSVFISGNPIRLTDSLFAAGNYGYMSAQLDLGSDVVRFESSSSSPATIIVAAPLAGNGQLVLRTTATFYQSTSTFSGLVTMECATGFACGNAQMQDATLPATINGLALSGRGTVGDVTTQTSLSLFSGTLNMGNLTSNGSIYISASPSSGGNAAVTGTVTLQDVRLFAFTEVNYTPPIGSVMLVIANDGTDPVQGTFNNAAEGGFIQGIGWTGRVSYVGGDGNDVTVTVVVAQTIDFPQPPATTYGVGQVTVSATGGGSGQPVVFTSQSPSVCTTGGSNGATVTILNGGTCIINANQAGDATYAPASTVQRSFIVARASQVIAFTQPANSVYGATATMSATGGASNNPVVFTSASTAICTTGGTNGATVTMVGVGTCRINANQAGNAGYNAAQTVQRVFTVGQASQAISFTQPVNSLYGATATMTATGGGSSSPVVFTSTTTSICTTGGTNGATVTMVGVGTCTIDANQAGTSAYSAAPTVTRSFSVAKAAQGIVFGGFSNHVYGSAPFFVSATGGNSGNAVVFSSLTPSVCTTTGTNGTLVSIVAAGACSIDITQAGNANYEASETIQGFTVTKADQQLTLQALPSHLVGETFTVNVSSAGDSGIPVVFSSGSPSVCTSSGANGASFHAIAQGSCIVNADQAGNANYNAAATATATSAITGVLVEARVDSKSDFNADSRSDITWLKSDGATAMWLMNGPTQVGGVALLPAASGWTIKLVGDLNGDGKADLVWQHTDGRVGVWLMDGTTQVGGGILLPAGTNYTPVMLGDFNGDGKADIVWQRTDGTVAMWLMNGATQIGGGVLFGAGTGWSPRFVADFNGDGRSDLVWEHTDGRTAMWLMNGATQVGGAVLLPAGTGWSTRLVGDFNGDGKADLLWQHTDGRTAMWLMNSTTQVGGGVLLGAGTGWSVTRVGDVNGDRKDDIVWQRNDGTVAVWTMNGFTQVAGGVLANAGTGWSARRIADFSGDGVADIVMSNTDGSVRMWVMNGTSFATSQLLPGGTGYTPSP